MGLVGEYHCHVSRLSVLLEGQREIEVTFLLGWALNQFLVVLTLGVSSAFLILVTFYHSKACRYLAIPESQTAAHSPARMAPTKAQAAPDPKPDRTGRLPTLALLRSRQAQSSPDTNSETRLSTSFPTATITHRHLHPSISRHSR